MNESAPAFSAENEHVQIWVRSFSQVLAQIAGSPFACVAGAGPSTVEAQPADTDLWITCTCSGGLRGELSFRLPSRSVLALAQIFMSEPRNPEASLTSEHREAAIELLRQIAGVVASSLKSSWGEVQLRLESATGAPSWSVSSQSSLRLGEDASAFSCEVRLSAALAAALRTDPLESETKFSPDVAAPTVAPPASNDGKLDLLMEVELGVVLRFGSRKLLLREVLDLTGGAVVDLDRQVQEPVEMLLDGRLLARGELVVSNGNYGLRVTEIASIS